MTNLDRQTSSGFHWWEHLLHNQSALRLKARLLFQPGVMVTSVPWQLGSAEALAERPEHTALITRHQIRSRTTVVRRRTR